MISFPGFAYCEFYKGSLGDAQVSFEYPKGWDFKKVQGKEEKYDEIFLRGPMSKKDKYSASLSVTMYPQERFGSIEELAADYKGKYSSFKGYSLVNSSDSNDAIELEIEYLLMLPFYSVKAEEKKIKESVRFLKKGNNCFKVRYSAVESDYPKYLPDFHALCKTFQ